MHTSNSCRGKLFWMLPLGEKPCCLQSESVEPKVSIKKYGTSSVAMEINSMETAFKPQEDIIKCFGFYSDVCCNSVVVIYCIVFQFNDSDCFNFIVKIFFSLVSYAAVSHHACTDLLLWLSNYVIKSAIFSNKMKNLSTYSCLSKPFFFFFESQK